MRVLIIYTRVYIPIYIYIYTPGNMYVDKPLELSAPLNASNTSNVSIDGWKARPPRSILFYDFLFFWGGNDHKKKPPRFGSRILPRCH